MASIIVTMKIMPSAPTSDLESIRVKAENAISSFGGKVGRVDIVPVAFGLKSVNMIFIMDESKGSTETLENQISSIDNANSVDVIDVRRALG